MKKWEALKYCDEMAEQGWMAHKLLLELYEDNEEVPEEMLDLICYEPQPRKPYTLIVGAGLMEQLDMVATMYGLIQEIEQDKTKEN